VTMKHAIREACKYITKTDSWRHVPAHHLIEILLTRRWPRMFEVLGYARAGAAPRSGATSLDTQPVSVGDSKPETAGMDPEKLPRPRAPDWFDNLSLMEFPAWVDWYTGKLKRDRWARRRGLAFDNELASFMTLSGRTFSFDAYVGAELARYRVEWSVTDEERESLMAWGVAASSIPKAEMLFTQTEDGYPMFTARAPESFCQHCGEVASVHELEPAAAGGYWCRSCIGDYVRSVYKLIGGQDGRSGSMA